MSRPPSPHHPAPPLRPGGRARVLVVEDEAALRRILAKILDRLGYDVETAEDGRSALALLDRAAEAERPDVVITDLVMPRMSGIDLLRALEERAWNRPVVLMTGHLADGSSRLGRHGAIGVTPLQKPMTLDGVRDAVETALATATRRP